MAGLPLSDYTRFFCDVTASSSRISILAFPTIPLIQDEKSYNEIAGKFSQYPPDSSFWNSVCCACLKQCRSAFSSSSPDSVSNCIGLFSIFLFRFRMNRHTKATCRTRGDHFENRLASITSPGSVLCRRKCARSSVAVFVGVISV